MLVLSDCPGIDQTTLRNRIGVDSTTMSDLVKELTDTELIVRAPNLQDKRRNEIGLSEKGNQVLDQAIAAARGAEDRFTADLTSDEVDILFDLLSRLLKGHRS